MISLTGIPGDEIGALSDTGLTRLAIKRSRWYLKHSPQWSTTRQTPTLSRSWRGSRQDTANRGDLMAEHQIDAAHEAFEWDLTVAGRAVGRAKAVATEPQL